LRKLLRYLAPPLLTLVAAVSWMYWGSAHKAGNAPDVSGGEYAVGDLLFDVPAPQRVFLNADAAQTLSAQDGDKRIAGFNVLYRRAHVETIAPGASVALAFMRQPHAFARDSWCRDDADGEKGGKFQQAGAAQPRSGGFYVYDLKIADAELLVSADGATFFGAPATLTRRKNGQTPGTGVAYEYEYMASAALSPQVILVASFNDLALKDESIGGLLGAIEKDVRRWAAMARPGQVLGRTGEDCSADARK
jgi:hypothetical protein